MPDLTLENKLWQEGFRVIGCDEAGRGTWAGPMFVGAVTLYTGNIPWVQQMVADGLIKDSKRMTANQRFKVYREMMEHGIVYAVGDANIEEIDKWGVERAFVLALNRAGQAITAIERQMMVPPAVRYQKTAILIDGSRYRDLRIQDTSLSEADDYEVVAEDKLDDACATVSLASIAAKVHQQTTMLGLARIFPEYGFDKHNGYPTKAHKDAVGKHGTSIAHRTSWNVDMKDGAL